MLKLLFLALYFPLITTAQTGKGIKFEESLSLDHVKTKAKIENKLIFIDCFTTWCGPCKKMENEVYTNDEVGTYFNDNFICVKVQMDKTEKDNASVQQWYSDAETIEKQYKVLAYPSYIFISAQGAIVHKETGIKSPTELLTMAKAANTPGKNYKDPYAKYDNLIKEYKQGKKNYSDIPYMIKTATELGDFEINNILKQDYNDYLLNLDEDKLYTKENIEYIASIVNSNSRFFNLFFRDKNRVDEIMKKKGFAESVVDRIIINETINPFLQKKADSVYMPDEQITNEPDPDWSKLYNILKNKYSKGYAKRNLLEAKIIWHEQQKSYKDWIKYYILKYEKYGIDTLDKYTDGRLNTVAWEIFQHSTDNKQLAAAIRWMTGVVRRNQDKHPLFKTGTIDTYACLLYKSGKTDIAIQLEEKALDIAIKELSDQQLTAELQNKLDKMKKGQPIWNFK